MKKFSATINGTNNKITCTLTNERVNYDKLWTDADGNLYTLSRVFGRYSFWPLGAWRMKRLQELRKQGRSTVGFPLPASHYPTKF